MKLPVTKLRTFCSIIVFACGLVFAESAAAKNVKNDVGQELLVCAINGSCDFSSTGSSAQSEKPFMFYAKEVELGHPRYHEYSDSIDMYPSASTCLNEIADGNDNPAKYELAWQELHSLEDLEVCLFRIFQSFQSYETTKSWLEKSDFSIRVDERLTSGRTAIADNKDRGFGINAIMDKSTTTTDDSKSFFDSYKGWFGKKISVTVIFDPNKNIEHLGITVIRK